MTARKTPVEAAPIECAWRDCSVTFTPRHPTAQYHSATCRQRAARDRKAAAAEAKAEEKAGTDAEHNLVTVTRRELDQAGVLDTVDGQIALVLARRAAEANASGVSTLMRELRTSISEAKASKPAPTPTPDQTPAEEPTKLDEARRRREQKARQAADRT